MEKLEWTKEMSIGYDLIDDQHRLIFRMINRLVDHPNVGVGDEIISEIISELRGYGEIHFQAEEAILKKIGYPGLQEHRDAHRAYKAQIVEFACDVTGHNRRSPQEIFEFLGHWWVNHVQFEDMQFKKLLIKHRDQLVLSRADIGNVGT